MILLPHFTRSLLTRTFFTWLILRAWVTAGSIAAARTLNIPPPTHPALLSPRAVLLLIGIVAAAGWISARRRNEDLFLLSMGYSRAQLLGTLLLPVVLLESAVAIVLLT